MQNTLSFIRTLMIVIGSFLIGNHFFNQVIDAAWWDLVVGGVLAIVGGVWAWKDKLLDDEKKESFIRNTIAFIGGILVNAGVDNQKVILFTGAILPLLPFILSYLQKNKNEKIIVGDIQPRQLKRPD